jgi:hypothetical protein
VQPKLYYKDPAWDGGCWAVVTESNPEQVIASGLSAPEAMRQSAAINRQIVRLGNGERTTVKFADYPGIASDQFGKE